MAGCADAKLRAGAWGLAALGLALVLAPAGARAASKRPFGGALRVPMVETLQTTDPALVTSESEWLVARQLHESLYRLSLSGDLVPALAQGLPQLSDDGLELLIQLKPGLVFHDGSAVTADDVIASWHRLVAQGTDSPHWWLLAPVRGVVGYRQGKLTRISGLERVNRMSLRVRLRFRAPEFPRVLASVPTAILPVKAIRKGAPTNPHPPGAGAFTRPAETDGEGFTLVSALKHWRGRPFVDRIQFSQFQDARKADLAFELGRVDWAPGKPRRVRDYHALTGPQDRQVFLAVNPALLERFPEGLRRALVQAIDRRALADYVYGQRGEAADELLLGERDAGGSHVAPADPAKARAYFEKHYISKAAEALLKNGELPEFKFIVRLDRPEDRAAAERIQVDLMDVGVSVTVLPLPLTQYLQQVQAGDYDFRLERPLPLASSLEMQLVGAIARIQGVEAVEELLTALARLPQDDSRAGIVRERARGFQVQIPWLPLFIHGRCLYVRGAVRGLGTRIDGLTDLADVWLAGASERPAQHR